MTSPVPHDVVGEPGEGGVHGVGRYVSQCRDTELRGGAAAVTDAFGVGRVTEGVLDSGVHDEECQAGGLDVEGNLPHFQRTRVEEQRVTRSAPQRSGLVHDACGDTDVLVLSPSGDERQFLSGKRKPVQVVQRQRDRALQGCRRRKAGPDRNVTVDEELDAGKFCPGFA